MQCFEVVTCPIYSTMPFRLFTPVSWIFLLSGSTNISHQSTSCVPATFLVICYVNNAVAPPDIYLNLQIHKVLHLKIT